MKKRFMRLQEVIDRTGKSRAAIYRGMRDNTFPPNIKTGDNTVAWLESDIDQWIDEIVEASRGVTA